jgi:hypothetical protein
MPLVPPIATTVLAFRSRGGCPIEKVCFRLGRQLARDSRRIMKRLLKTQATFRKSLITNPMSNSWSNSGGPKSQIRAIRRRRFPRFVFSSRSTPLLLVGKRSMSARTPGNTGAGDAETFGPVRLSS